ncbi:Gfo/Idh/MocA family protein [Cypionkella psychrotolerans]|uniref:Gfo/Idh/MocA family protein n=1 Tax=Cypionkella psychrotolerans TaxID=1678131 RepID=UPI0006B61103|nr:Gfo/Idh/MocA family oxidoreductase [Cypionkella psychrotolerans]
MLRWGIAGTGFISDTMARAIASSVKSEIVAVSGQDAGRLAGFADRFGIAGRHLDYEEMLADPGVDAVYIGLPSHLHHQAVRAAAAQGKMIVSEKPLTTTMVEAEALAEAVRAADVFFVEGLMYLHHPLIAAMGEIIGSGRLGAIRSVRGAYEADIWRVVNPKGRGTIYNLGCYPASLLQYVMQVAYGPEAFGTRQASGFGNLGADGMICDAALTVRFDNGVLASIQASDSYGMAFEFAISGEKGVLCCKTNPWLPGACENILQVQPHDGAVEEIVVSTGLDAFQHQVVCVENAHRMGLKQASRPAPLLADSLEVMAMLTTWEADCLA